MKTGAAFVGSLFSAAVGIAIGYAWRDAQEDLFPGATTEKVAKTHDNPAAPTPTGAAPKPAAEVYKVPVGNAYQKGPDDALVTIVEFSDFQCPFCGRVLPTLEKIEETYGDDVRVAFRHQPLPFHRQAPLASEYALAAGEQGKFWEMHDKLFANQKALAPENLKSYAKELGLDQAKIDAFIESGKGKKMIQEDQALARQVGANGTPAFYINGVKLSGAQPFETFKRLIDAEKARAEKLVASGVAKADVYAKTIANGRTSPAPEPKREQPAQPAIVRQDMKLLDTTPAKGAKEPLVTLVEFSDFQCPFCSRVNPTLKQVMDEYGDDVQIRFRNQPLSFHPRALPAAKAALAAGEQGKFWEMHDKLFENQKALGDEDLKKYAGEIGLDVAKFEADLASEKIAAIVAKDQQDAAKYGARGTPTLFANGVMIRGAQPFPAFKTVIDKEIALAKSLIEKGTPRGEIFAKVMEVKKGEVIQAAKPGSAPAPAKPAAPAEPVDVEIGNAPVHGPKDAPIEVVMFSDFECPFCSRVNPSMEQLEKEYGDKVKFSFKHFPLGFHRSAKPAAIASLAAHRQGKFWEMHEKMFANQKALTEANFKAWAEELGLDVAKFEADLKDPALAAQVDADMAQGSKVGVRGTPATFINGRLVSGAQPYPAFKAIVDEELKKSDG